jgi:hypothetical protein
MTLAAHILQNRVDGRTAHRLSTRSPAVAGRAGVRRSVVYAHWLKGGGERMQPFATMKSITTSRMATSWSKSLRRAAAFSSRSSTGVSPSAVAIARRSGKKPERDSLLQSQVLRFDAQTMKLVVFDLDGTLTDQVDADEQCFVRAFADAFGIDELDRHWMGYKHVTDSWVLGEVFRTKYGRTSKPAEILRYVERYVALLARHPIPRLPRARTRLHTWNLANRISGMLREVDRRSVDCSRSNADPVALSWEQLRRMRTEPLHA